YRGSPYGGNSSFRFIPLPGANPTQGPNAPFGALGSSICLGNDCATTPPANYGRYAVLSPPLSLATLMATGQTLSNDNIGDSEPSAFMDDASLGPTQYVYAVHGYLPGSPLPDNRTDDLAISRAQLNGGSAPLSFMKWNGQAFGELGLGGAESPILPDGAF